MRYTKNEFEKHVETWDALLSNYTVPTWDELPPLELYMDQVIVLMNKYLKTFVLSSDDSASLITPPMINNYVKLKAMPAPYKKKYSKIHLAYLIMISSLKHALSIPTISSLIPLFENEDDVRKLYENFTLNQQKAFLYVKKEVIGVTDAILQRASEDNVISTGAAIQLATSAAIFKILSDDAAKIENIDHINKEKDE